MLTMIKAAHLALWLVVLGCVPAGATTVVFDVVNLFGNTYEYSYTVENDSLAVELEEFAVYFEVGLFENLRMPVAPPFWDAIVIEPDVVLPDDGFYDALATLGGIPLGGVLGRFTVWADFLGGGAPGSQRFEILDPVTFDILDSGLTRASTPIPAPASVLLIGIGLLAARWFHRARGTT